jgi:multidrug transporter EmrE-like cation transporter
MDRNKIHGLIIFAVGIFTTVFFAEQNAPVICIAVYLLLTGVVGLASYNAEV